MHPISERMETFLFICFYNPTQPTAITKHIALIQARSRYSITVFNLFEHRAQLNSLALPSVLNLDAFDGLIIHHTISMNVNYLSALDKNLKVKISVFSGVKCLCLEKKNEISAELTEYVKAANYDFKLWMGDALTEGTTDDFIVHLDTELMEALQKKARIVPSVFCSKKERKNVLLLVAHEPVKDPRLGWVADSAPETLSIMQLGLNLAQSKSILHYQDGSEDAFYQEHMPGQFDEALLAQASKKQAGLVGVHELLALRRMLTLSDAQLFKQYAMPYGSCRHKYFMWYVNYFCNVVPLLLAEAVNIRGLHAIIASDLPTLLVALILKSLFDIPVFYDAHEYWPEQDIASFEFEKQFWRDMERRLLTQVDYCQTVSDTLAAVMTNEYQKTFESVPNCIPLRDIPEVSHKTFQTLDRCRFLFQGGFAEGRGIELLISVWPKVHEKAFLMLRGPDGPFKQKMVLLAKKTGLLDKKIFFLPAVREEQLIEALKDGDVGLIPYEPLLSNNANCCPNKLSQYLSASLPVLANDTYFIKKIIHESQAGKVVDFQNQSVLIDAINFFVNHQQASFLMGERGYHFSREHFHWEKVSGILYESIETLTQKSKPAIVSVFKLNRVPIIGYDKQLAMKKMKSYLLRFLLPLWRSIPDEGSASLLSKTKCYFRRFLSAS